MGDSRERPAIFESVSELVDAQRFITVWLYAIGANMVFYKVELKTFKFEDLIDRTLQIKSYKEKSIDSAMEIVVAIDIQTGELFVLREINKPISK